jgi:predicted dehydrogenase
LLGTVVMKDVAHLGPTLQVLEAGIACFAAKPLAMNRSEAAPLLVTARRHNVRFGSNFNHRVSPLCQRTTHYIAEGRLGAPACFLYHAATGMPADSL